MKVYCASKMHHLQMWRHAREEWAPKIQIISRWIDATPEDEERCQNEPLFAQNCWERNLGDIDEAHALVLFALPNDHLRGALVEAGIALKTGLPLVLIGDHADYGTWQHTSHRITKVPSLTCAYWYLMGKAGY
jgi:hypothetical protein